ncbi:DMT family transporter [Arenicella sp. 4NH20-0111]|uniref:DMT family transporter n=1 Tax=Arenicella sp. 4NH20-0111 TaxID=3127648 RepID=UPI0031079242
MSNYNRAITMVIIAGAFLSTLGIGSRLLESASGMQVVFYRSIGLLITMTLIIAFRERNNFWNSFIQIGKTGIYSSICLVGTSIFVVLAVMNTSVANAMFIISLTPLIAGLFAWLLLREKMTVTTIIATIIALIGVFVIINGAISTDGALGIVYAFAMLMCYGMFSVTLRMGKDVDMLPCIALHAAILLVILTPSLPTLSITLHDLLICLGLGVFQLGVGLTLLTIGSKSIPAAQLTLLAMLEVVLSPVWVWIGVGESPSKSTMIGGAIIISAIMFQALKSKPTGQP